MRDVCAVQCCQLPVAALIAPVPDLVPQKERCVVLELRRRIQSVETLTDAESGKAGVEPTYLIALPPWIMFAIWENLDEIVRLDTGALCVKFCTFDF
ncbi:unnamed protein product [Colias eurytheme]|nr:unnamed protein product [Colias eurytheme]